MLSATCSVPKCHCQVGRAVSVGVRTDRSHVGAVFFLLPRTRAATSVPPHSSPTDTELACRALEHIKHQLQKVAELGGGKPIRALLVSAADDCPDAVIVTDDSADIHVVNSAATRLTGLSSQELRSLSIWDLTHPVSQADFDVLWKEFLRAGRQRGLYSVTGRDGSAVEVAYCAETNVLPQQHVAVLRKTTSG